MEDVFFLISARLKAPIGHLIEHIIDRRGRRGWCARAPLSALLSGTMATGAPPPYPPYTLSVEGNQSPGSLADFPPD
jgi:hypothetical protein